LTESIKSAIMSTMSKSPIKNRLVPFKILSCILYGRFTWIEKRTESETLLLSLGPMARSFRITSSRLRDQLEWLRENNYLESLALKYGCAEVRPKVPPNLFTTEGAENGR
jgi:hypothetical protein